MIASQLATANYQRLSRSWLVAGRRWDGNRRTIKVTSSVRIVLAAMRPPPQTGYRLRACAPLVRFVVVRPEEDVHAHIVTDRTVPGVGLSRCAGCPRSGTAEQPSPDRRRNR